MLVSSDPDNIDATDVAINANIILTFNTQVTAPDTAFSLTCGGNDIPFAHTPAAATHTPSYLHSPPQKSSPSPPADIAYQF